MAECFPEVVGSETTNRRNDSGNPDEINAAIANGATGVTLNPLLLGRTLFDRSDYLNPKLKGIPGSVKDSQRAEEIARIIMRSCVYRETDI